MKSCLHEQLKSEKKIFCDIFDYTRLDFGNLNNSKIASDRKDR